MEKLQKCAVIYSLAGLTMLSANISILAEPAFEIKANKPDAIYRVSEEIVFSVRLMEKNKAVTGQKVVYKLEGDGGLKKEGSFITDTTPFMLKTSLDFPGWVLVRFTAVGQNDNPTKVKENGKMIDLSGKIGAMVDPLKITPVDKRPTEFDEFWKTQRALLNSVPITAELVKVALPDGYENQEGFDVKINCAGEMPVTGYLLKPVNAVPKSLPALVHYRSAMVASARMPLPYSKYGVIALDVNPYGIANGQSAEYYKEQEKSTLRGYTSRNKNDREKYYFHDMVLRVLRALEYVKSIPEWDGKHLIVVGGSMGGWQTIVAAALDPDVTLAIADVPALCDFAGVLAMPARKSGGLCSYKAMIPGKADNPAAALTGAYYDGVFFAPLIKCDIYVCTGFIDEVCPPSSVFAFYNNLSVGPRKFMTTCPTTGHYGRTVNTLGNEHLNEYLSNIKAQKE